MQIRRLTDQDKTRFGEIERDAFQIDPNYIPEFLERSFSSGEGWGISDEQDELVSVLRVIYPQMHMGQKTVTLAGITSVATPPEHRRNRYLNTLLTDIMGKIREQGHGVSGLYPFEFPFYKRFGYSHAANSKEITVQMSGLAHFKKLGTGRWKQKTVEDWADFNDMYNQACVGKFGQVSRTETRWRNNIINRREGKSNTAYMWYDEKGQARAYVVYHMRTSEHDMWERKLLVDSMAWLDDAAYYEILAFLANHDSQAQQVIWNTWEDEPFLTLLDDPRTASEKISAGFMFRIIDAKMALEQRPYAPEISGSFSLTLHDDRLDWNDKLTLQVHIENGQAHVKAEKLQADNAGLVCDVRQLAQFYMGFLSPMQALRLKLLEVRKPQDLITAQNIFTPQGQPLPFMADFW